MGSPAGQGWSGVTTTQEPVYPSADSLHPVLNSPSSAASTCPSPTFISYLVTNLCSSAHDANRADSNRPCSPSTNPFVHDGDPYRQHSPSPPPRGTSASSTSGSMNSSRRGQRRRSSSGGSARSDLQMTTFSRVQKAHNQHSPGPGSGPPAAAPDAAAAATAPAFPVERVAPPIAHLPPPPLAPYVLPEHRYFPPTQQAISGPDPRTAVVRGYLPHPGNQLFPPPPPPPGQQSASGSNPPPSQLSQPAQPRPYQPQPQSQSRYKFQQPITALFDPHNPASRGLRESGPLNSSSSSSSPSYRASGALRPPSESSSGAPLRLKIETQEMLRSHSGNSTNSDRSRSSGSNHRDGDDALTHAVTEGAVRGGSPSRQRRTRVLMTNIQSRNLNRLWQTTKFPSSTERENLATEIALTPRQVQVWFQNQRQKHRRQMLQSGGVPEGEDPADYENLGKSPKQRRREVMDNESVLAWTENASMAFTTQSAAGRMQTTPTPGPSSLAAGSRRGPRTSEGLVHGDGGYTSPYGTSMSYPPGPTGARLPMVPDERSGRPSHPLGIHTGPIFHPQGHHPISSSSPTYPYHDLSYTQGLGHPAPSPTYANSGSGIYHPTVPSSSSSTPGHHPPLAMTSPSYRVFAHEPPLGGSPGIHPSSLGSLDGGRWSESSRSNRPEPILPPMSTILPRQPFSPPPTAPLQRVESNDPPRRRRHHSLGRSPSPTHRYTTSDPYRPHAYHPLQDQQQQPSPVQPLSSASLQIHDNQSHAQDSPSLQRPIPIRRPTQLPPSLSALVLDAPLDPSQQEKVAASRAAVTPSTSLPSLDLLSPPSTNWSVEARSGTSAPSASASSRSNPSSTPASARPSTAMTSISTMLGTTPGSRGTTGGTGGDREEEGCTAGVSPRRGAVEVTQGPSALKIPRDVGDASSTDSSESTIVSPTMRTSINSLID